MPQYLDDNAPRFGRKRAKDLKVYHVRKGLCGPDLISKYIWHLDSHYSRYKFLGTNGQLKNDAKNHPYPSLVAAQNLLLDAFDLPYSLNKCKRWTIMEIGRKSISSVQNRSIGLRVSICCHQVGREVSMRYNNPESNTGYSYDSDMVSEFHSSNDGSELHLKGRNMKFVDVYRRKEVARRKKKRRYYRQKFPLLKLQGWVPEKEQDMIDFEQRSTHVVFKQQSFSASFRLINMDDGKNPKEANRWYQEMRSRTAERKQRKNERKQKKHKKFVRTSSRRFADRTAETKKTPNNRCRFMKSYEHDDSVIELEEAVTFQLMLDGVAELSEHEEECERKPWKLALSDFNISGFKKKRKYSKKKAAVDVCSPEYGCWLRSSPSLERIAMELPAKERTIESTADSEVMYRSSLPSFVVRLDEDGDEENLFAAAKQLLPHANKLVGVSPETYFSKIDEVSDKLRDLIPELVDYLSGYVFMMWCLPYENTTFLRCIVNRDESSGSEEKGSVPRIFGTCASLSRFVPCERFVASTSYAQQIADNIASAQLLDEMRYKCEGVPSTSVASSYCAICDSDSADGFALQCAHFFCRECWASHASFMLTSGYIPITCPDYGCNEVLAVEHMLMLLPVSSCERYKRMLASKCMLRPNWLQCATCTKALSVSPPSSKQYLAHCECGTALCLRCKQNIHPPLLCDEARQYFLVLDSNGQLKSIFDEDRSVMVKRCPFCGSFCERSDGCNHMLCVCGESFCYVCSQKWNDSSHYDCTVDVSVRVNLFDVSAVNATRLSLNTLDKCLDYRRCRSAPNLFCIEKKLAVIFKHDMNAVRQVVSLYATVCEVLELNAVGMYQFRRRLRHSSDARVRQRIAMIVGILHSFENRLSFLAKRITTSCDHPAIRPPKITQICDIIESSLFAYMNEVF